MLQQVLFLQSIQKYSPTVRGKLFFFFKATPWLILASWEQLDKTQSP